MYISIKKNDRPIYLLDIGDLQFIHAAGMPNGAFWIHGASEEANGVYKSVDWEEIPISVHDTITVCLVEDGVPFKPTRIVEKNLSSVKEKLSKIINRDAEDSESIEKDENYTPSLNNLMEVYESEVEIFNYTGDHVQFEINWKKNESPTILFWGSNERDYSANKEVSKTITKNEIVIRFVR